MHDEPGWLARSLEAAAKRVSEWDAWKRDLASAVSQGRVDDRRDPSKEVQQSSIALVSK